MNIKKIAWSATTVSMNMYSRLPVPRTGAYQGQASHSFHRILGVDLNGRSECLVLVCGVCDPWWEDSLGCSEHGVCLLVTQDM